MPSTFVAAPRAAFGVAANANLEYQGLTTAEQQTLNYVFAIDVSYNNDLFATVMWSDVSNGNQTDFNVGCSNSNAWQTALFNVLKDASGNKLQGTWNSVTTNRTSGPTFGGFNTDIPNGTLEEIIQREISKELMTTLGQDGLSAYLQSNLSLITTDLSYNQGVLHMYTQLAATETFVVGEGEEEETINVAFSKMKNLVAQIPDRAGAPAEDASSGTLSDLVRSGDSFVYTFNVTSTFTLTTSLETNNVTGITIPNESAATGVVLPGSGAVMGSGSASTSVAARACAFIVNVNNSPPDV